jgi:hypothetical protein
MVFCWDLAPALVVADTTEREREREPPGLCGAVFVPPLPRELLLLLLPLWTNPNPSIRLLLKVPHIFPPFFFREVYQYLNQENERANETETTLLVF